MSNEIKKNSKYEEVIIKTILANQIFEKNFLNDDEMIDWRDEVNKIYNKEDFDGDMVLAQFITNGSFEHNKEYEISKFIPTNISSEIDENIEKKFISKNEDSKNEESKVFSKEEEEEEKIITDVESEAIEE